MNSWILSIVGIVCSGVIIDLIMPEGKTSSFVKSIFALFVVFVIVSPIPSLLNNDFSLSSYVSGTNIEIDYAFIATINRQKQTAIETQINEMLYEENLNANIETTIDAFDGDFEIISIFVTINNINEFTDENELTKCKKNIIKVIQDNIDIAKEVIKFNG